MRVPQHQVKQGILHPEQLVRDTALHCFCDSFTDDPTVMPVAIQAIETFGWDGAFEFPSRVGELIQTEETLLWFIDQLNRMGYPRTSKDAEHCFRLGAIIAQADVSLLMRHDEVLMGLEGLPAEPREDMAERLRLMTIDTDALWWEMEEFCQGARGKQYTNKSDLRHVFRLAEAIGRDGSYADRVLTLLSRSPAAWITPLASRIAGEMRLEPAVPLLVASLAQDGGDVLNEQCARCFAKVGTDTAVKVICQGFAAAPRHYRLLSSGALGNIRSELVVAKCLELSQREEASDIKGKLIRAALNNFSPDAIEPARQFVLGKGSQVRRELVAVAMLAGVSFPELARWTEAEKYDAQQRKHQPAPSLDRTARPSALDPLSKPAPLVRKQRAGRNDPCPCGSAKKYKKCCGKNE